MLRPTLVIPLTLALLAPGGCADRDAGSGLMFYRPPPRPPRPAVSFRTDRAGRTAVIEQGRSPLSEAGDWRETSMVYARQGGTATIRPQPSGASAVYFDAPWLNPAATRSSWPARPAGVQGQVSSAAGWRETSTVVGVGD